MKIKNLKFGSKAKAIALGSMLVLSTSVLTGCGNHDVFDTNFSFNKAIIFNDDKVCIIDIAKWRDYDGEQIQLILTDGTIILTSSFDTKLINDEKGIISAEEIAKAIAGDDIEITYLDPKIYKKTY